MENKYRYVTTYMQGITTIEIYNVEEDAIKCCYKRFSTVTTVRFINTAPAEEAEIMNFILRYFYF